MNHTDDSIKQLFNELVDTELGPVRPAPAFDDSHSGKLGQWKVPLLAASVVALLAAGSVLAIDASRSQRSVPAAGSPIAISKSVASKPVNSSAKFFDPFPEAAGIPGVVARPVTAAENKKYRPATLVTLPGLPVVLKAGKSYTASMQYISTSTDEQTMIISLAAENVAAENCPPQFLGHAGHSYVITCTLVPRSDVTGKLILKITVPAGYSSGSIDLKTH